MTDATGPTWTPGEAERTRSNPARLMRDLGFETFEALHAWSVRDRPGYWSEMVRRLGVSFDAEPRADLEMPGGVESAAWFPGARLNIVRTCMANAPERAIVHGDAHGTVRTVTRRQLAGKVGLVMDELAARGVGPGDTVGLCMPMTPAAIAAELAVVALGGAVAAVPESLSSGEIAARLRIAGVTCVLAVEAMERGGKRIGLYERLIAIEGCPPVVLLGDGSPVRACDRVIDSDAAPEADPASLEPVSRGPADTALVLFSSGTTAEPKAIPWEMTTPIKCAADAHAHHDVRLGDAFAWPTSLGWMMGPWLVFASMMNGATIVTCDQPPTTPGFAGFVADAGVTHLGLVPTIARAWRNRGATEGADWSRVRLFSSTGEVSHAGDQAWLMARPRGDEDLTPVIEYCGGTEIGGGYITGSVVQPQRPGRFSTPALGLDLRLLDESGLETPEAGGRGEVFIVGPSVGLSRRLLNAGRDHHAEYHADAPADPRTGIALRRHGDELERVGPGEWRAHGRSDDAMNLGGIKVSAAELERAAAAAPGVAEVACVAVSPGGGGPAELVAVVVPSGGDAAAMTADPASLRPAIQAQISGTLSPLFKVARVEIRRALPRTPSNKVMRRELRRELEHADRHDANATQSERPDHVKPR